MNTCETCRFWSERLAWCEGCGPVKAYCLGKGGPLYGKYTTGRQGCAVWAENHSGAVDDPANEGMDPYADEARAEKN